MRVFCFFFGLRYPLGACQTQRPCASAVCIPAWTLRSDVIIELVEGCDDTFHHLPDGRLVDRLRDRAKLDSEPPQVGANREVVVLLPRKPAEAIDDHILDAPTVLLAVVEELEEVGPLRRFRGLTLVHEDAVYIPSLLVTVATAFRSWVGRLRFSTCRLSLTRR